MFLWFVSFLWSYDLERRNKPDKPASSHLSRPSRSLSLSPFLNRDRLKALRPIVARIIDQRTHGVGHELFAGIGTKQGLEGREVLNGGVEPLRIGLGWEQHRHAVMDRFHEVVRLRREDRAGFDRCPLRRLPQGGSHKPAKANGR